MSDGIAARPAGALASAGALEASIASSGPATFGVREGDTGWRLLAWAPSAAELPAGLAGEASELDCGALLDGPAGHENAAALRAAFGWLRPRPLGPGPSAGVGDRLGIAGPGHVAAFRANPGITPTLAQQSARELGRSGRTFAEVVDAATFGAFAAGWRSGYGADADHLKTTEDIDAGIAGGCTMFTADPIELVPDLPADAPDAAIAAAFAQVPWRELEDDEVSFAARYPDRLDLGVLTLALPPAALRSAAARFGLAVVQVAAMYRHLVDALRDRPVEFEVAVDEIDNPTTAVDHVYIATELRRLGVQWASLAPRFVGEFEKGIDYKGDRNAFAADAAIHAAIARTLGPYKLSVHSGSDKFSIYDVVAAETRNSVHLKTSGTSYLAALRTLAETEPELMRRVWAVAREAYASARASYHVSATANGLPDGRLDAERLVGLLDNPNTREILHVTYGAVLRDASDGDVRLGDAVGAGVWKHRDAYWNELARHIGRHLRPFSALVAGGTEEEERG